MKTLDELTHACKKAEALSSSLDQAVSEIQDSTKELIAETVLTHADFCEQHLPSSYDRLEWSDLIYNPCPECRMEKVRSIVGNLNRCLRSGKILEACYYGEALDLSFESMFHHDDEPEALAEGESYFENHYNQVEPATDPVDIKDNAYRCFLQIVEDTAKDVL